MSRPGKYKCFIYFITNGEDVKIGFTYDISKRLRQIQTYNPKKLYLLGFIYAEKKVELAIHSMLKTLCPESHLRGEWFCLEKISRYLELFNINYNKEIPSPIETKYYLNKKGNIVYNKKRREWYKWNKRAEAVGVDPLPSRRPTPTERRAWENSIIQKENNEPSK